jgi:amino acid adenylation domain-containing protein/non-ribosomal peptide synthase protein (TIGR01720 family)
VIAKKLKDVEFIHSLEEEGFALRAVEGKIRCVSLEGRPLDAGLRAEISRRKEGLLRSLANRRIPLSSGQERIWFLEEYGEGEESAYHMPSAFRIKGRLDLPALNKALSLLVERHESLRTVFKNEKGRPCQKIAPPLPVTLRVEAVSEEELPAVLASEARRPFSLDSGPPIRFRLFRLPQAEHVFMLTQHHIVSDGWSTEILLEELSGLYRSLISGVDPALPPPGLQYADYALRERARLRSGKLREEEDYWEKKLADIEEFELFPDHPRPAVKSCRGSRLRFRLGPKTASAIRELAREEGATPFMVLLAGLKILFCRIGDRTDIAVGSPIANRAREELERTVGFFVNTLVLRTDLEGNLSFREALTRVKETCREAYAHPELPFGRLVDLLQADRDPSRSPLFGIMFVLQNPGMEGRLDLPGCRAEEIRVDYETAKFDLAFEISHEENDFSGEIEFNTDLYRRSTIRRLARYYQKILSGGCLEPGCRINDLDLLTPSERRKVLIEFNRGEGFFPAEKTVPELFREEAAQRPERTALVWGENKMTYRELDRASDLVAHHLRRAFKEARGEEMPPETIVALAAGRGPEAIVGILGIMKSGGAYLPLDPGYPPERIKFLLEDSGAKVFLTVSGYFSKAPAPQVHNLKEAFSLLEENGENARPVIVFIDGGKEEGGEGSLPSLRADSLAYLIYTSGSTGRPKGVLVEYRGITNLVEAQREGFGIDGSSRVLQFAQLTFDASVSEIFTAILAGAELHLISEEERTDPDRLLDLLESARITTVTLPPALLAVLPERRLPELKTVVTAGDVCDPAAMRRWAKGRTLINAYGPTEGTVCATLRRWKPGISPRNIGPPLSNVKLYVLDSHLLPVPIRVPGELYLGGPGVARGYLNRPELTRQSFIEDPFAASGEVGRIYKTGDRVRWLESGELEFLGRIDSQIKVRGVRVAPGEVESALNEHPGVLSCAVVPIRGEGAARLVAYWVPAAGEGETPENPALREFLSDRLPAQLIPAFFVSLKELPLTTSGKLDRKALPAPERSAVSIKKVELPPRTAGEKKLARIWKEVLKLEEVSVDENFFALGGDSIMSIQVISRARAAGLVLTPRDLFTYPTITRLAGRAGKAPRKIVRRATAGKVPLTPIQRWFFEQKLPAPSHFNQAVLLRPESPLQPELAAETLNKLIRRHAALRFRFFRREDGTIRQYLSGKAADYRTSVREEDLSGRTAALSEECSCLQASLDIETGPLIATRLFKGFADGRQRVLVVIHHLAVDAFSWQIILDEFEKIYRSLEEKKTVHLPRKTASFGAWGESLFRYLREQAGSQWDYWLKVGRAAAVLPLELTEEESYGREFFTASAELDEEETKDLLARGPRAYRARTQDILLSALLLAWARVFERPGLLLHLEGHGREDIGEGVDLSRTVGWFTSLFPVDLKLPPGDPAAHDDRFYSDLIKGVKEELRSIPDRGLGYGVLRYFSGDRRVKELEKNDRARVAFNYLGRQETGGEGRVTGGLAAEDPGPAISPLNSLIHPLEVNAYVRGGKFRAEFGFSLLHLRKERAERLAASFQRSLRELLAHCLKPESGGYTPSDFPLARLNRSRLDELTLGEVTESIYPLTPMQEGLLFHLLYAPASDQYIEQLCWDYHGRLGRKALKEAWEGIVSRHGVFRTAFFWEGLEKPVQVVRRRVEADWREEDWRENSDEEQADKFRDYIARDRRKGFDLHRAGLNRFHLIQTGDQTYTFIWCFHHILTDGWCFSLLLNELRFRYQALIGEEPFRLPAPPPFEEYLGWLDSRDKKEDETFWSKQLAGFEEPTPLGINRRPLEVLRPIREVAGEEIRFSERSSKSIVAFAREQEVTVNALLLSAWAVVLARYSGQKDVVLGVNVSGRPGELPGVESMVGLFVNAVPLRCRLDPEKTGWEGVREIHRLMQEVNSHSYGNLADLQKLSGVPAGTPLFLSEYVFENYPVDEAILSGYSGLRISGFQAFEKTNYPLGLMAAPGREITLQATYDIDSFTKSSIERLLSHIRRAAEWIMENPGMPIGKAQILSLAEQEKIFTEWSGGEEKIPEGGPTVVELFRRRAEKSFDQLALTCGEEKLTYRELDEWSDRIASALDRARSGEGGEGGDPVGLCLERGPSAIAGILGIMKARSAYLPLDPAYPPERLRYIFEDSGLKVVVTGEKLRPRLEKAFPGGSGPDLIILEEIEKCSAGEKRFGPRGEDAAYVIYTSGSTGAPKGAVINHRDLSDHSAAAIETYGLKPEDTVLQFSTLTFDASLEQIFPPLIAGASLVMRDEQLWTPGELADRIRREKITVINLPTAYWREVTGEFQEIPAADLPKTLRLVIIGGDTMDLPTAALWRRLSLPPYRLLNAYGPTETTITAAVYEVSGREEESVPIGRPFGPRRFYVLDSFGRPSPPGVPGELSLGGIGVGRGYLHRPEETEKKFVDDPFAPPEERERGYGRLYRTGDMVRFREDGNLEFLGRVDFQVKVRGFRIELGEVEAALLTNSSVSRCAVVVRKEKKEKELIAYCVAEREGGQRVESLLREAARESVSAWESLYDELYGGKREDEAFDIAGWNSSFTGEPIPVEEMKEWVENTARLILDLHPKSVLEVGCGTGLLLYRVAPRCRRYLGVDFSSRVIERLSLSLEKDPIAGTLVLRERADGVGRIVLAKPSLFPVDTVVINSVIQYFPGLDYLERVLEQALAAAGEGRVFIGDVRNFSLARAFHLQVAIGKGEELSEPAVVRSRVERELLLEKELLVAPGYFLDFARRHPEVSGVEIMPKEARFENEMSRFRYDVILHLSDGAAARDKFPEVEWRPGIKIEELVEGRGEAVVLRGYPSRRTWEAYGLSILLNGEADLEAEAAKLKGEAEVLLSLAELHGLAGEKGCSLQARLALAGDRGAARYDLFFFKETAPPYDRPDPAGGEAEEFANCPARRFLKNALDPEALRSYLNGLLPEQMVPGFFVELERLPLTPTGKADRRVLAGLGTGRKFLSDRYLAPRSEEEQLLAAIYGEVLGLPQVGVEDDFFRLGGHSLTATRAAGRIQRGFGISCSVKAIFDHPTIARLARYVRRELAGSGFVTPTLQPAEGSGPFPLSYAQQRLWFIDRLEAGSGGSYHMPAVFRLLGNLDLKALQESFSYLITRHESLRTVFRSDGVEPFQEILPPKSLDLPVETIREGELENILSQASRRPFDLEIGPLIRVRLFRIAGDEHVLMIDQHHIISDAWSAGVFFGELSQCYRAFLAGRSPAFPPLPIRYADFAAWQRSWLKGEVLRRELDYWRKELEGARRLRLAEQRAGRTGKVRRGKQIRFHLDKKTTAALKLRAREASATLYMAVLSAFSALLGRYSGEEDVLVGTVLAGRSEEELEGVIGFFINTLALRVDLSADPSFAAVLGRAKKTALEAYAHQDLPFEKLVAELRPEREAGRSPLLGAMLVFQNLPEVLLELEGIEVSEVPFELGAVRSDLDLYGWEEEGGLEFSLVYDADLFEKNTVETMARRFQILVESVTEDPARPFSSLRLEEETRLLLPPPKEAEQPGEIELSPHQERIWFIDRFETGNVYPARPVYHNIPLIVKFSGEIDFGLMEKSLNEVVERHAALRTEIVTEGEEGRQSVRCASNLKLEFIETLGGTEEEAAKAALAFALRPFTPSEEPRLRVAVIRRGEREAFLVIAAHHIIADRESMKIIARETAACYNAGLEGRKADLPPVAFSYPEFSRRQRSLGLREWEPLFFYWKWELRGELPVLKLLEDRPRPAIQTFSPEVFEFSLGGDLSENLRRFAAARDLDLFSLLLGGFQILLSCYSGQKEMVVGIPGGARPDGSRAAVGPFSNLLPVRGRLEGEKSLSDFLERLARTVAEDRLHGELPFDLLVKELNPPVDMSRTALFDVLFDFDESGFPATDFGGVWGEVWETNLGFGKYDLNLLLYPAREGIGGTLVYNADIYDPATAAGMMDRLKKVLENSLLSADKPLSEFSFLDREEEKRLQSGGEVPAAFPGDKTLPELFAAQATRSPSRIAVVWGGERLSYRELDEKANRLAHYLKKKGVGRDRLVAVCLERTAELVVALLGVLKAGGAYLPLEPSFPPDRLRFLIEDSGVEHLVTTTALLEKIPVGVREVVILDRDREEIAGWPAEPPADPPRPEDLAYSIYTSGSTGRPKGVLLEHRNVVRLLMNDRLPFDFGEDDVWTMFHSFSFDFSVWEMYGALLFGGRLVVVAPEATKDPGLLIDLIRKEGVTVLNQVPSAFYSLADAALAEPGLLLPLRSVIFGGEALDCRRLSGWRRRYPGIRLVNMYGITETTVHVTFKEVGEEEIETGSSSIGRPLPETSVYIMDNNHRLLPSGVPGEICVGGGGVGRGYLGRDELTREKFIPNPFRPGERIYRSGDRGRLLPAGEIEYLGRIDGQVQVRGFRVETGEIESRLIEHPGVARAAVRVWEGPLGEGEARGMGTRLAVYWTPAGGEEEPEDGELREFLAQSLPAYMIPSAFIRVAEFPLTPGGKIDRRALPDPERGGVSLINKGEPRDPVEFRLREIWEEVTGVNPVSIRENFFFSGGHSLLAVHLVFRINLIFGTEYPVSWVFINETIEEQARSLRKEGRGTSDFRPLLSFNPRGRKIPLFFVHPGQAGAEAYCRLASLLEEDQPFYAIESHNLYNEKLPLIKSIEDLAAAYLPHLRAACPEGPCCLGGWSFGGLVAFEMAARLIEEGRKVPFLFLIDTFLYDEEEKELLKMLAGKGESDVLLKNNPLFKELPPQYLQRLKKVMRLEFEAMADYPVPSRPSPGYPGRVLLVKPREEESPPPLEGETAEIFKRLAESLSRKEKNGWEGHIPDLEILTIPGNHHTMMEQGLGQLVKTIRSQLNGF